MSLELRDYLPSAAVERGAFDAFFAACLCEFTEQAGYTRNLSRLRFSPTTSLEAVAVERLLKLPFVFPRSNHRDGPFVPTRVIGDLHVELEVLRSMRAPIHYLLHTSLSSFPEVYVQLWQALAMGVAERGLRGRLGREMSFSREAWQPILQRMCREQPLKVVMAAIDSMVGGEADAMGCAESPKNLSKRLEALVGSCEVAVCERCIRRDWSHILERTVILTFAREILGTSLWAMIDLPPTLFNLQQFIARKAA